MNDLRGRLIAACVFSALLSAGARAGFGGDMSERADGGPDAGRAVQTGEWGGEHISLRVTGAGATVEFDCGRALITRRLRLDRRGRFDAAGVYYEERGGPVRQGEQTPGREARFDGRVSGQEMRLTVTLIEGKELIGNFVLVRGREPTLVKCR